MFNLRLCKCWMLSDFRHHKRVALSASSYFNMHACCCFALTGLTARPAYLISGPLAATFFMVAVSRMAAAAAAGQ